MEGKMITVEKSRETTQLVLDFMNTLRKEPITLQGFKNQRVKEAKSNRESYDSDAGGLVPFSEKPEKNFIGTISSQEMLRIVDEDN